jgi:hypothetical protein
MANSVYPFAPTGSGAADYVQISLGREIEWRAGPIVNPSDRPWSEKALVDPSWVAHDDESDDKVIAGPLYRLAKRSGSSVVHLRTFLALRAARAREARGGPSGDGRPRVGRLRRHANAISRSAAQLVRFPAARSALLSGLGGIERAQRARLPALVARHQRPSTC